MSLRFNNNLKSNITGQYINNKNMNNNAYAYFIIYVCVIIILGILFWLLYKYFFPNYKKNVVRLSNKKINIDNDFELSIMPSEINLPDLKKNDEYGITFGFKIYLENAMENESWGKRVDQLKPIIKYSPGIYYHPVDNYFEFNVELRDNIQMNSYQSIKYVNPPLQKWLSIIVVYTSTKILVYSNQELVINKKLKNPPIFKKDILKIGEKNNNFKGILGDVLFWGYPLDISEIQKATWDLEY
jgi:hypothetical protein